TLADAPLTQSERLIGPVELSVDGERARSTAWARGGHLAFQPDLDGVIRRDAPVRVRSAEVPSLPLYAARVVEANELDADDRSSRLIRWPRPGALPKLSTTPSSRELEGHIVVAGPLLPLHATPFGFVATPELVAQALTSHLGRNYVAESSVATTAVWLAALFLCIPFLLV